MSVTIYPSPTDVALNGVRDAVSARPEQLYYEVLVALGYDPEPPGGPDEPPPPEWG